MKLGDLKTWRRVLLINISLLIGFAISAFILPPNTPAWLWALVCLLALLVLNYFFLRRPLKVDNEQRSRLPQVIMLLGFVILLLDLIYHRWLAP